MSAESAHLPAWRGAAYGLVAAALFGASAPVAKALLGTVTPTMLAGLLYLGAAMGLWLVRLARGSSDETPLRRQDAPALALIVLLGGIAGPILMLHGLQRLQGITGSLLLNLEAPFTMLLAVLLFREHLGGRTWLAIACILGGALVLKFEPGQLAAMLGQDGDRSGYHRKVEQLSKKRREVEAQLEAWELAQRGECAAAARANERIADLCDRLRQLDVQLESAHTREASLCSVASLPTVRLAELWRILIRTSRQVARAYLEHLVARLEVHAGVIVVVPKASGAESAPT
jgi:uncharacterized membrane protein